MTAGRRSTATQLAGTPRTTISDVASRAGVAVSTVSRVLNDGSVADATRDRVRHAIAELDFRPHLGARALAAGSTGTIGMVIPYFSSPSAVERLNGVLDALSDVDHELLLENVSTPAQRAARLGAGASPQRVDGLMIVSLSPTAAEVAALQRTGTPLVLVDADHPRLPRIVIDDVAGGHLATEHLIDLGHERIAFVGDAPDHPLGFRSSERRRRGYVRALTDGGVAPDDRLVARGPHSREVARELAASLLGARRSPTAVFAASDLQALGVLEAASAAGRSVPGELSVIGFDDLPLADHVGLTTVRQPLRESGVRGVERLLETLAGAARGPLRETLPLTLRVRSTTAPPEHG